MRGIDRDFAACGFERRLERVSKPLAVIVVGVSYGNGLDATIRDYFGHDLALAGV